MIAKLLAKMKEIIKLNIASYLQVLFREKKKIKWLHEKSIQVINHRI